MARTLSTMTRGNRRTRAEVRVINCTRGLNDVDRRFHLTLVRRRRRRLING